MSKSGPFSQSFDGYKSHCLINIAGSP